MTNTLSAFRGAVLALLLAVMTPAFASPLSPEFDTSSGKVQGFEREGFFEFRGIPYAEPPVGSRRWAAPQEVRWRGTFFAGKFGNSCATALNLAGFSKISGSEDCLYLNIAAPKYVPGRKYPVLFWIHGGGLQTGSADEYDPSYFVKQGVVVVSVNYRLGMLGFFGHESINGAANTPMNFGLLDQQAALHWVQQNIESFGGDAANVTLYGESAGGHSVLAHIFSPLSKGLFRSAIVSSGAYHTDFKTANEARQVGAMVASRLGCSGRAEEVRTCLMAQPASAFVTPKIFSLRDDAFIVDGVTLRKSFPVYLADGDYNRANLINGFNSDEGTFFADALELQLGRKVNREDYLSRLRVLYGKRTDSEILAGVKLDEVSDFARQLSDDVTRHKFICPAVRFSDEFANAMPVYQYEFGDKTAPQYLRAASTPYAAGHTGELIYFFRDFHGATGTVRQLSEAQRKLSDSMLTYWINFIRSGNPNSAPSSLPTWGRYTSGQRQLMFFADDGPQMLHNITQRWGCR